MWQLHTPAFSQMCPNLTFLMVRMEVLGNCHRHSPRNSDSQLLRAGRFPSQGTARGGRESGERPESSTKGGVCSIFVDNYPQLRLSFSDLH